MQIDPKFRSLIPPPTPEERRQLEANLLADGCRDPLVVWEEEDFLLDGHNRWEICSRNGIPFKIERKSFPDRFSAMRWMITNQRGRRNLTPFTRCEMVLPLEGTIREKLLKNKLAGKDLPENSPEGPGETRVILADLAGVSSNTLAKVKYLLGHVDDSSLARLRSGETSIHSAYRSLIEAQVEEIAQAEPEIATEPEHPQSTPTNEDLEVVSDEAEPSTLEFPCNECGEVFPCPVTHCPTCNRHLPPWEVECLACSALESRDGEIGLEDEDEESSSFASSSSGEDGKERSEDEDEDSSSFASSSPDEDDTAFPPDRTEAAQRWVDLFDRLAQELGELLISIPRAGGVIRLTRGWPDRAVLRLKGNLVMLLKQAPDLIRELEAVLHDDAESEVDDDLSDHRDVQSEPAPSPV